MSEAPPAFFEPLLASHGIRLTAAQRRLLADYAALLERWNRRINLVGTRDRATLWRRHVADCLMLETVPRPATPRTWLDVGAGAGLPAVPLAVLHPEDRVLAVETVAKKVTFLQEVARGLPLPNLVPLRGDVYALAGDPAFAPCDVLVARAFAALPALLALGLALLRPGGEVWAMKGRRWEAEAATVPPPVRAGYADGPQVTAYRLDAEEEGCILVYRRHPGASR